MPINSLAICFFTSFTLCWGAGIVAPSCGAESLGYELVSGRCYKFHTHGALWLEANRTCAAEGAQLAAPNTEEEAKVLKDLFARYPPSAITGCEWKERVAIGVYRDSDDVWKTADGRNVTEGYSKWEPAQPSDVYRYRYGAFSRYGILENFDGQLERAFICEKAPVLPTSNAAKIVDELSVKGLL